MKKIIAALAALFTVTSVARADITDGAFGINQIFDVQYSWSGTTLDAWNFISPYDSTFQHLSGCTSTSCTLGTGEYFKFFNSTTVPGTYGLALYNADGTLKQVLHDTGTITAIGPDAIFYLGSGFFGNVITPSAGYTYGEAATFTSMVTTVTSTDITSYTWASTTPLNDGETAGGGTTTPTITGATSSITRTTSSAIGTPVITTQTTTGATTRTTSVTYGNPTATSVNSDAASRGSKNIDVTRTVTTTTRTPVATTHVDKTPVSTVKTTTTPTVTTVTETPVTTITMSDGTTTTQNGTPVVTTYTSYTAVNETTVTNTIETTVVNTIDTAISSSNSTKSVSALGTKHAIASRNMNLFVVDALGTKDGVWASPTARYTQTVGNYRLGGISGGYQSTVDNNTFGFAAYYEMGESKDFLNSTTDQKSYGVSVYALSKQDYAWLRVAFGASQSDYKTSISIPEFALINNSKVKQNNFYADVAVYAPTAYAGFRPLAGVIVNDSTISSASEYGSLLLSTLPSEDSSIKALPYAGTRFEIDEDVAAEFRVIQSPDFKTVGSVRGTVKKEIYDGVFVDITAGFDKGFTVDYNNAVGKAGLKFKF